MSSFGQWYEDKRAEESGSSSQSWMPAGQDLLPLFNVSAESINMPSMSWESMKSSMEAQMPQKVMGMGYQQRFKVSPAAFEAWNPTMRQPESPVPCHLSRYFVRFCFYRHYSLPLPSLWGCLPWPCGHRNLLFLSQWAASCLCSPLRFSRDRRNTS